MTLGESSAHAFRVHSFRVNEWLLWSKPDSTWAWSVTSTGTGGTRLVARIRAWYDWQHPLAGLSAALLMEFGDFAMLRRMLRGIKARAESRRKVSGGCDDRSSALSPSQGSSAASRKPIT